MQVDLGYLKNNTMYYIDKANISLNYLFMEWSLLSYDNRQHIANDTYSSAFSKARFIVDVSLSNSPSTVKDYPYIMKKKKPFCVVIFFWYFWLPELLS